LGAGHRVISATTMDVGCCSDREYALLREYYSYGTVPRVLQSQSETVVDPVNLDRNLLLADLRKLSAIVENEEEENTAYEKPAAPTVRQKQPVSNHSRL
jgi:hypothetical protein